MSQTPAVINNPALSRFELDTGDGIAVANYHAAPGVLTFFHTEVPPRLREQGIASRLVHDALEQVRAEGLKIVPDCDFVRHYIDTHPEFQDLVASV
jgi:predicted GNAT family acetyltransferase